MAVSLILPFWPPARTVLLTASIVPEMLGIGWRPLSAYLPDPRRVTTEYGGPADRLDIYLPHGADERSSLAAVVLALGVHPVPIDHPDIVRLANAIGRHGIVVAIPDSTALRNLRVTPDEPAHLADAVLAVAQRPEVDPARVGLAGFSAGASIALIAAADARIAETVSFVSAFGGYATAERLLVDVATRTTLAGGEVLPWLPDPGIRHDVLELMLGTLPADRRDTVRGLLAPIVAADSPPAGPRPDEAAALHGDARGVYLLFTARDRSAAGSAIASFSPGLRDQLRGISPLDFADRIRAPVFVLHGAPDNAIPFAHAALIVEAVGDEVVRFTSFGEFGHEQPGREGLDLGDAGDVWGLTLYLRDIVAAATE